MALRQGCDLTKMSPSITTSLDNNEGSELLFLSFLFFSLPTTLISSITSCLLFFSRSDRWIDRAELENLSERASDQGE